MFAVSKTHRCRLNHGRRTGRAGDSIIQSRLLTWATRNVWWWLPMFLVLVLFLVLVVLIAGDGLWLFLNDPT